MHNSPENSPDERSPHDRDRRPPQRPPMSQIGGGAVVPPMAPISGPPPINVTLVQESPSGRRRNTLISQGDAPDLQEIPLSHFVGRRNSPTSQGDAPAQGDAPDQLPEASDSLDYENLAGNSPEKAKAEAKKIKAVGTLSEVVEASKSARAELLPFVQSEIPASLNLFNAFQFGLATFNLRFVFKLCPFLKRLLNPFTREMVNLGGLERGPTGQMCPPPPPFCRHWRS
jgi:hypothetical protein